MTTTAWRRSSSVVRTLAWICLVCSSLPLNADDAPPHSAKRIGSDSKTGFAQAVVVDSAALLHTPQFFPLSPSGQVLGDDAASQTLVVLRKLTDACRTHEAKLSDLVKLNLYVANEAVAKEVLETIAGRRIDEPSVAISVVQTRLPKPEMLVALDAIVALDASAKPPSADAKPRCAVLPLGPRVYVSGQAEKGATLAEATTKTMQSLKTTLTHLGSDLNRVVQVKSFLTPMSDVASAEKAITEFFAPASSPPMVFVEWQSTLPIEIEFVASVPPNPMSQEPLEFITPPGMTASPVFCRVVRINDPRTIFVSGLYSREAGDGAAQVNDVFAQLQDILKASGSDLRHLAKATYYVGDAEVSGKLNELRPKFYDPQRPPAASKAQVFGVGMAGRSLTLDMIAVPAKN